MVESESDDGRRGDWDGNATPTTDEHEVQPSTP